MNRRGGRAGFSLVEVVLAIGVLALGVLALVGLIGSLIGSTAARATPAETTQIITLVKEWLGAAARHDFQERLDHFRAGNPVTLFHYTWMGPDGMKPRIGEVSQLENDWTLARSGQGGLISPIFQIELFPDSSLNATSMTVVDFVALRAEASRLPMPAPDTEWYNPAAPATPGITFFAVFRR